MHFSIVIPTYNSSSTITELVEEIFHTIKGHSFQIVLVNDGSSDDTHAHCTGLADLHPETVLYIPLEKNSGQDNAILTGLRHARGDYVIIMDDDFQNPPSEIPVILRAAAENQHDLIYCSYSKKHQHWFRQTGSALASLCATLLLNKPASLYMSSFKCLTRSLVNKICADPGPLPCIDGLALRYANNIGSINCRHAPSRIPRSRYTPRKLIVAWLSLLSANQHLQMMLHPLILRVCSFSAWKEGRT